MRLSRVVGALPSVTPFVSPEAIVRDEKRPLRLRLGANESWIGPSDAARQAMARAIEEVWMYGDPECHDLRERIAAANAVPVDRVFVGPGIDGILGLIAAASLDPGDRVVASLGCYPTFGYAVRGVGGEVITAPYRDDHNNLAALMEHCHRVSPKLVYLPNPDNPSGTLLQREAIEQFVAELPEETTLVLDEAYAEFANGALPRFGRDEPRVIRLRTFSKVYGMAGCRVGVMLGSPEAVNAVGRIRMHFAVNRVGLAGALACFGDQAFIDRVVADADRGKAALTEIAVNCGFRPIPSHTNFLAMDTGSADRARSIVQALRERDVFIRMPWGPPLDACIRVTVGSTEDLDQFGEILREVVQSV